MADDRAPDDARDPRTEVGPADGAFPSFGGQPAAPPFGPPPVAAPSPASARSTGMDLEPVAVTRPVDPGPSAVGPPRDDPEPSPVAARPAKKKHGSFLRELPVLLVIAFALALLIKAFLVQAFYIPSGSMENTLQVRDRVLVNKLVYRFRDIHRGEIVVFNGLDSFTPETVVAPPANAFESVTRKLKNVLGLGAPGEKDFIKRVIGIPGDTVACCVDGKVTVNGRAIDEPYVFENNAQAFGPEVVPEGELFVMGDHRSASDDSRAKGTVPADKVIGRAFVVIWPPEHFQGLKVPRELEGDPRAVGAQPWSLAAVPPVLGLAGAVPIHLLQRDLRRRRRRRRAGK